MALQGKLGKLTMPKKKSAEDNYSMTDLTGDSEGDEDTEAPDEERSEVGADDAETGEGFDEGDSQPAGNDETSSHQTLTEASDDELMSELRKRGLEAKAKKASKQATSDSDY